MAKNLVIVESPAKAKTIGRFLGRSYAVTASLGHVRDLPNGKLGVDIDQGFKPSYVVPKDKKALVANLNKSLADTTTVYLATDPDREGEAIAWHLTQAIKLGDIPVKRVVFHEITETAIKAAFEDPRDINVDLVNAQQTRRILDRIVGYRLSPLLWKKIRRGLSAGRVQSPALRMIVDRERAIDAFVAEEYWRIVAELTTASNGTPTQSVRFHATLTHRKGETRKLEIPDEGEAAKILADLDGALCRVDNVKKREIQKRPVAPFTTSTLQQEAGRKLRFSATRTMRIAQQLYEGLPLGKEGSLGLITYMRTDSPVISPAFITETRGFINSEYGNQYLPSAARTYSARSKGAQEAHEAIRPTSVFRTPASIKEYLDGPQSRLYELIWKRVVASQMTNAVFDSTAVEIDAGSPNKQAYRLRATGSIQKFDGFLTLYSEGTDVEEEDEAGSLPALENNQDLNLQKLDPQQKFTQPPPRFTEASLVKALEENGIGRPSTYAPTISTIVERGYVKKEGTALHGQVLGSLVNDLLQQSFPPIIDASFTATMETELDEIARGGKQWVPVLEDFYKPFEEALTKATETLPTTSEPTDEVCVLCERPMVIKKGRNGLFLACTGYPECKGTKDIGPEVNEATDEVCILCERPMVTKKGRFGLFFACTGYPECKGTKPYQIKVDVKCPECGPGELVQKKSKKGKTFYSCSAYPDCTFITNLRPIPQPCPLCNGLLTESVRHGIKCTKCDFKHTDPSSTDDEATTTPHAVPTNA